MDPNTWSGELKNHYDWRRNKSARVVKRSNIAIFVIQGQITLDIIIGFNPKSNLFEILRSNTFCIKIITIGEEMKALEW